MRFVMTTEGAERLNLDPAAVCYVRGQTEPDGTPKRREFNGPAVREGLLGGFPRGVIAWGKRALKVQRTEQLDLLEQRLLYYTLAIRQTDHTLLPIERFDDLALTDFDLVKHAVPFLDQDGDCGECSMPVTIPLHIQADPPVEVPPTRAPESPETTETATG